jgi:Putative death-receptor fusion protein (DUF2428)
MLLSTVHLWVDEPQMGSWLLTRETCAALASVLTAKIFSHPASLISQAGGLLISTLISLKHAGAAFAASRALQQLTEHCFDSDDVLIRQLPSAWANRLMGEISSERVRDSTLRRSTGFALGFLSIMRSEMVSKVARRALCPFILQKLIAHSLPSRDKLLAFFKKIKLPPASHQAIASRAILQVKCDGRSNEESSEVGAKQICSVTCQTCVPVS